MVIKMKQGTIKRLLTGLLTATLLCVPFSVSALGAGTELTAALDQPTLQTSAAEQTVRLTVKTKEPVSICAIGFTAVVPEGLELAGIENGSENITFGSGDVNLDNGKLSWMDGALNDVQTDEIGTLVVTVPANTPAGTYVIEIKNVKALAEYGTVTVIESAGISATLTVSSSGGVEPTPRPGDVNGDGKVNNRDAILLFRYVSGRDVEVNEEVLDVNKDGTINNRDVIMLFRMVSR